MGSISVDRLTVAYGNAVPVLRDVSVDVPEGRILAVTGWSGAGKTTLLRAMAGLLPPREGTVTVDGAPAWPRQRRPGRSVVIIPQDNGLLTALTAVENIEAVLIANQIRPGEARRLALHWLERLGLSAQRDQVVEELSGGQQQRTAIARGLALQGSVVLADEVLSELDAASRGMVLETFREEANRGAAVILATHDAEAAAFCDAELQLTGGTARPRRSSTRLIGMEMVS
ncbi:ABC transporter ATP-binding protein [Phytoactinopolyspora halotolerans]|uniref:ATP-binding cassette domain-containing protein n=1 Tax=Phytoactinopolyspora halotolerans TaxID=1981512 RepID=A0A6L9S455_9ACTN|nr:ATP-binding cassette domain-containing protein [Phytoactinopolyspora halotolerans]NED99836.1 ATP-binding cassette domain-containing protein [Phytoactinopolyspora halotolerans]